MVLLDLLEDLQAVQFTALKPNVEQHQARLPRRQGFKCPLAVRRLAGFVAFVFENPRREGSNVGFVVDD